MEEEFTSNEGTENKIEYKFAELFDLNEIQKLQDLFSAATGVASIITEPDGTPITRGSGFCSLCSEIRKTEKGLKNCLISDSIIGRPNKDGPRIQSCLSGGLIDAGASIIVEGRHIANWLIGQVLVEDCETEDLLSYADVIGVDRDVYRSRLMEVKRMSMQQFESICSFLYLNAQQLSKYAMQKETLQAIIDSIGAGIVMLDPEGKITFINDAWKDLFSYLDIDRSYYSKDNFYINNNTSFGTELFIRKMLTGIDNRDEIFIRLKDLTLDRESRYSVDMEQSDPVKRFLNLYSNPCVSYAGHTFGRVFVVRDISHQKEVDRLKLELISTVSHELRTPMSSILGFSELLLTRKLSEERHKEYIGIINSEARRLTGLINEFLDIQRIESGKQAFNKQFHSMALIIEEAVKLFENAGDKHNIIYKNSNKDIPQIYCDRDKILQVLSNLLSNAVKYSPKGGDICIDLALKNGYIQVSVTDQGLGIPKDAKDKIFSKFFRIDDDDRRKIGGTGLGLAICKEIVRAHGGEIGVVSVYGQGSTFYFSIPSAGNMPDSSAADKESDYWEESCPEENETADDHTHPGNDYVNMPDRGKVLLVDDDVAILKLLETALTIEGYTVYICDDSASAMDLIADTRPDIVMLDVMMPELNGYELLQKIKSESGYSDIHVIFLSAANNVEDKIKGMKSGADDYITKPFVIDEVMARVETVLRRSNKYRGKLLRDDLTDAYSRYYFNRRMTEEIERYKRNGTVFSIAFIDMDHYKIINDKYGHQTGDSVLKELVSYLNRNIRRCDSLYRYGGEEFIILMPDTLESKAFTVIERLRKGFAQKSISVGGTTIKATFSAGITQVSGEEITGEQLIGDADKAMYRAKYLGRNKVVVYNRAMSTEDYKRTLLLADDENTILKLLGDRLSNIGYNIVTARDGNSAVAFTNEIHPDAVILDSILPDMDGFEVCRQIKANAATCTTKVIMLSRKKEKKNMTRGLYYGADDYLTKPFSMVELEARIVRVLNN